MDTEQQIVGAARIAIIASEIQKKELSEKEIYSKISAFLQPTAGENNIGDENELWLKRLNSLALSKTSKNEIINYDPARKNNFAELTEELKSFPTLEMLHTKAIEGKLLAKNYQLDLDNGSLHCISNERQYVPGQNLADLKDNFYFNSTELEQKTKFFDSYFRELAKSGSYKGQDELRIMDIGTENGDLTKAIAEAALKYFPDKKIILCAVERTGNFLDETNEKLAEIKSDKLNYVPVNHHVGSGENEKIKSIGSFDIVLGTDLYNFSTPKLLAEVSAYSAPDAVLLLKHSNEKDFQQKVKDSVGKAIRNFGAKAPEIDADLKNADIDSRSGEIKTAFNLGVLSPEKGLIAEDIASKLIAVKKGDFLHATLETALASDSLLPKQREALENGLAQQRVLEFILGAPLVAFEPEQRAAAINSYNNEMGQGAAYTNSTSHIIPVSKEISPDVLEANYTAFAAAIESVKLRQHKSGPDNRDSYVGK